MSDLVNQIKLQIIRLFMLACRVFPVNRNKVVIMSYYGKGFSDNGKAIALSLLKKKPTMDIVWAARVEEKGTIPTNIRFVEYCSLKYYWEMATAGVWIDNCRKGIEIIKRKNQYYIQTWHGMVALKRIEKDVQDQLAEKYVMDAKWDSRMADIILSGCGFFTKLCRRAFWYDGEILECGSPRLDVLFQQSKEKLRSVKAQLGIDEEKKVLLYAPTFRANGDTSCYIQNYEQILNVLKDKTGDDWVAAVRLHPNIANEAGFITYSDKVINATAYPDLYEIIPVADIVISDYSSLMFDAGLIDKTVLLYATDIEAYVADRNFYFDIEKLPFPLARSSQELLENMLNCNEKEYLAAVDNFNESLDYYENGTASETVANKIMEVLSK